MENILNRNIGELVAEDYRTAAVFKKNKIDFCCNGNRTINEAAEAKKINKEKLQAELNEVLNAQNEAATDVSDWPLDLLSDYIVKKHHRYVREKIPVLSQFLQKLCRVHGERHPELFRVAELFAASANELEAHLQKEEQILFPFIENLEAAKMQHARPATPAFVTAGNPIKMMMHEHSAEGERFATIAALTNDYTPPADACNTYKVTYAMLQEFENDLHRHIHLENNVLFPKTIELEQLLNHGAN